ncbi:tRNA (adenosine(37)-N6)-threonylcarbamoyltransferase complex dimerization subunit type 1 TsaB [Oscillatoria sp. FACHB-1406]|uniref:tRNA (adenosine(37)-N6)-threonylcarbamoyltransferase complex dimerization subunit type 1 TsaB n=1 Tax=Oscillatoria sp. FACHB-1406 TaxID=2692846 RepID=UPI001685C757|nr:tRNA (adenosine(37)-N6)-threonylcarbamoyltransferase complex dimerization subunit type 1 TsaB [Oscillatoria sp. FACHB-1406]MBD2577253.1 tRNA (adenosine(37)-N6)-threonylcarbamoyltransferase complex dimerization subunit type 1 TsaB [Oscillatoria sp. FACHB-1406]
MFASSSQSSALAIHATGAQLGLAIADFGGATRSQTWDLGRDLSQQLHTHLIEFVKPKTWHDFKFIAVAKGPGSFTSTRIGVVAARTLAQQLEIPLFAISNLAAVAELNSSDVSTPLAVQLPARREQIFVGIYQKEKERLKTLLPDTATKLDTWQEKLNALGEYRLIEASEDLGDTVTSILDLALRDWEAGLRPHWSEAIPFYGQHPVNN